MLNWHALFGKTTINQMVMSYYTILERSILATKKRDNHRNKRTLRFCLSKAFCISIVVHPVNEYASKQQMVAALKVEAVFS